MRAPSLTAEDYAAALLALLPPGTAWPRDAGAVLGIVARGLAARPAAVHERAERALAETYPPSTLELLPEWEASMGLPDECVGGDLSTAQRRAAVVGRLTARGGQSVPYLIEVAAGLGYEVTVEEHVPGRAGCIHAGDPCGGEAWAHAFTVHAPEQTVTEAVAGGCVAGDPLRAWGNLGLQCVLARIRPAHAVLIFAYGSA